MILRHAETDLLRPSFRDALLDLTSRLAEQKIPLAIFETIRSPERQNELYARGRDPSAADYGRTATRAKAYQSAHQFGQAADLVFLLAGGNWTWDEPEDGMWATYTRLAKTCGLETLSFERPHVQAAGFDWRQLARGPMDGAGWAEWLRNGAGGGWMPGAALAPLLPMASIAQTPSELMRAYA